MTLYSYIVADDAGFAPNPFHEYLTLACCKPGIRRTAQEGDYVVGLGPKHTGNRVVYAMRVTDTLDFDCYWHDRRFRNKRPKVAAGGEKAVGDNIYHWNERTGQWQQETSCHSQKNGQQDWERTCKDVSGEKVLISSDFIYWGGKGPCLPPNLRGLIVGRAHRSKSNEKHIFGFVEWFEEWKKRGYGRLGPPTKWPPSISMEGTSNRRRRC